MFVKFGFFISVFSFFLVSHAVDGAQKAYVLLDAYEAHIEDEHARVMKRSTGHRSEMDLVNALYKKNQDGVGYFRDLIGSAKDGDLWEERLVIKLIRSRNSYLAARSERMRIKVNLCDLQADFNLAEVGGTWGVMFPDLLVVPTLPGMKETLFDDEKREQAEETYRGTLVRFELINRLILCFKNKLSKSNFSKEARGAVNRARTLWPIVMDEKKVGDAHPDEGTIAAIANFHWQRLERDEVQQQIKASLSESKDDLNSAVMEYIDTPRGRLRLSFQIANEKFRVEEAARFYNTTQDARVSYVPVYKAYQKTMTPALLREEKTLREGIDACLELENIPETEAPFLKPYDEVASLEQFLPDYLKGGSSQKAPKGKKKKGKKSKSRGKKKPAIDCAEQEVGGYAPTTSAAEESHEVAGVSVTDAAEEAPLLAAPEEAAEEPLPLLVEEEYKGPAGPAEGYVEDAAPAAAAEERQAAPEAKTYAQPYPRGIRTAFSVLLENGVKGGKAPNAHTVEDIDTLFSKRAIGNYTFKDFKKLWEKLGGTIDDSTGGSHRHLVAPDKTPLWGTFVPHGGQGFGKNAIEYLRAAVDFVTGGGRYSL